MPASQTPSCVSLRAGRIDAWIATLDQTDETTARLWEALDPDERRRAHGYQFDRDRRDFIVCRGVLRSLLGGYLDCAPETLRFRYQTNGRPEVSAPVAAEALQFSLSHSGRMALFAIGRGARVGVDLEEIRAVPQAERIARRYFRPVELRDILAAPHEAQGRRFLRYWTCKEAYLKATGAGLSALPGGVEVRLGAGRSASLVVDSSSRAQSESWSLLHLPAFDGYEAALLVEGPPQKTAVYAWQGGSTGPSSRVAALVT